LLDMSLRAGTAVKNITPEKPIYLMGYPHVSRISTGVHDPLYATALYLGDGTCDILLIAVDVVAVSRELVRLCREAISRATAIPPDHILISATHTHSAPAMVEILALRDDPTLPLPDPDYLAFVSQKIIEAGTEAFHQTVAARAAITSCQTEGVGGNRHKPGGPSDPEIGIIYLQRKDSGSPLALWMVYSMHPTVLHEDSTWVSADFPGYARRHLKEHLRDVTVLYLTGPSGNQSPRHHIQNHTFAEAERLGVRLGDAVLERLSTLQEKDFTDELSISAAHGFVDLPGGNLPSTAEAEKRLQEARQEYARLQQEGADPSSIRTAECSVFGAEEAVTLAKAQENGEVEVFRRRCTPAEVQVLRIGDTFIAGLPGELFVEYGLAIKRQAPGRAFVVGLANGELQGYIVTPEARGYEADLGIFAPEAGSVMVEAAVGLMEKLHTNIKFPTKRR
jgi:neutral ceramidase